MARLEMRAVEPGEVPPDGGTAVQEDPDRPVFSANGPDDYVCAACMGTSEFETCASDAQQIECKSYFDAAHNASTCALFDAGSSNTCSPQNDADWASFINVFCGTGP